MILSDIQILKEIDTGNILIEPFDIEYLGTNSYDVHLGKYLAVYKDEVLDARKHNEIEVFDIPDEGFVLQPNRLYLGVTKEYTETLAHVPFLEGKASVARLGINIHAATGKGDVGFCNTWTMEISVVQPVRVYAGMPIGQLVYFRVDGEVRDQYQFRQNAHYKERTMKPVGSMLYKSF